MSLLKSLLRPERPKQIATQPHKAESVFAVVLSDGTVVSVLDAPNVTEANQTAIRLHPGLSVDLTFGFDTAKRHQVAFWIRPKKERS